MNFFCAPQEEKEVELDSSVLECDYDKNPTNLYQAIEGQAWVPVLEFIETGKWDHMYSKDRLTPSVQARTWVTRFEKDGSVRWSQLPLHAALIFGAPKKIISALIDLYPLSIRCTDDQQMLPLHLAFRFGADDTVITLLLQFFPDALFTKNIRGKVPTDIEGPRKDLNAMIQEVIKVTTENASTKQGKFFEAQIADLRDDLNLQTRLNETFEAEKQELEKKLSRTNTEFILLQNQYKLLAASKDPVPVRSRGGEGGRPLDPSPVKSRIPQTQKQKQAPAVKSELELGGTTSKDLSTAARASLDEMVEAAAEGAETRYATESTTGRLRGNVSDEENRTTKVGNNSYGFQAGPTSSSAISNIKKKSSLDSTSANSKRNWGAHTTQRRKTHGFFQGFGGSFVE
jgi:hypothetical protein